MPFFWCRFFGAVFLVVFFGGFFWCLNIMINQNEIIKNCKSYIKDNNLITLKLYYTNLHELNINVGTYQYIYQKIFLYTCIVGAEDILKWLVELYKEFDEISKIALRQLFIYSKYLLKKNKHSFTWFNEFLSTIRK